MIATSGGRELAATCWGDGPTAVLYLHGLIMPSDGAEWAHAPELRERLAQDFTYCEYERTNVGRSSDADGPIPFEQTIADVTAVVEGVGVEPPLILIGGSFGGAVALGYAAAQPDDVAGMVLLDPSLPGSNALEEAMLPPEWWLPPDAWQDSAELIDVYAADAVGLAALDVLPAIPGVVFVTEHIELPPVAGPDFLAAIREQQQAVAERFSPGEIVTVDTPHAMVPIVPDEIADAVRRVAEGGG